jgi:hypothetical protein
MDARVQKAGGIRLENEETHVTSENQQVKPKGKKKGKIAKVYTLHEKGLSAKEIASKMKINERLVRAYIWRTKNPEKYKALLSKYFAKRRQKQENEEIRNVLKKQAQKPGEKEAEEK